jgi:hypothetical protein
MSIAAAIVRRITPGGDRRIATVGDRESLQDASGFGAIKKKGIILTVISKEKYIAIL